MIVIAGAGIGGLTLGCALARRRRPFRIFERASELRPVGAGIALSANALRALAHIGLDQRVRGCGQELEAAAICNQAGRVLTSVNVRDLVPGGTIALARASLQEVLLESLGTQVDTGQAVLGYQCFQDGVRVTTAAGETIEAELLVAADGLRSTIRAVMRGAEPLRYSGQTSWRALADNVTLAHPARFTESWGAGQRFGIVPLGRGCVYWFAAATAPSGARDDGDPRERLRAMFEGWHPPIDDILAATPRERIVRTDIFDRPPIDRWADGRTVLLGDAAHPMTPDAGMGGCQAIEDAVVLADALDREPGIGAALIRYQACRIARANSFVTRSYRLGQIAHLRSAPLRWLRNGLLRAVPARLAGRRLARDLDFRL
jgi:2-polyprenyl-6-methoxyphenol hydroxylase-like FAD-dependent oxidoreductase